MAKKKGRGALSRKIEATLAGARAGDAEAQNAMGNQYHSGKGVLRNLRKAVYWYRRAFYNGDVTAAFNLGILFESRYMKTGRLSYIRQAFDMYLYAAKAGDYQAQSNLATLYLDGVGVEQDVEEAVYWMQESAAQGDEKAQYNLGKCYRDGVGVEADAKTARQLFALSSRNGNPKAMKALQRMPRNEKREK